MKSFKTIISSRSISFALLLHTGLVVTILYSSMNINYFHSHHLIRLPHTSQAYIMKEAS